MVVFLYQIAHSRKKSSTLGALSGQWVCTMMYFADIDFEDLQIDEYLRSLTVWPGKILLQRPLKNRICSNFSLAIEEN